jgi:hypothetical protein
MQQVALGVGLGRDQKQHFDSLTIIAAAPGLASWSKSMAACMRRARLDAHRDKHLQCVGYRVLRIPAALVTHNLAAHSFAPRSKPEW